MTAERIESILSRLGAALAVLADPATSYDCLTVEQAAVLRDARGDLAALREEIDALHAQPADRPAPAGGGEGEG